MVLKVWEGCVLFVAAAAVAAAANEAAGGDDDDGSDLIVGGWLVVFIWTVNQTFPVTTGLDLSWGGVVGVLSPHCLRLLPSSNLQSSSILFLYF